MSGTKSAAEQRASTATSNGAIDSARSMQRRRTRAHDGCNSCFAYTTHFENLATKCESTQWMRVSTHMCTKSHVAFTAHTSISSRGFVASRFMAAARELATHRRVVSDRSAISTTSPFTLHSNHHIRVAVPADRASVPVGVLRACRRRSGLEHRGESLLLVLEVAAQVARNELGEGGWVCGLVAFVLRQTT